MQQRVKKALIVLCGAAAAVSLGGMIALGTSKTASALPAYAQQTGKACGFCHQNPAGGGALKDAGKKFQANGHKL